MAKTTKKTTKIRQTKKKASKSSKVSKVKSRKAFKSYGESLKYLFSKTNYEQEKSFRYNVTTFSLERMEKLLTLVGNPHKGLKAAHIAGTKGKGSTATMLSRMLESNGYKVGLYTSPHVVELRERITVDDELISEPEMLGLLNRLHAPLEKLSKTDPPTFFEILTALAFMHFKDCEVDIAVIETGLGGRLDSTNVINPEVVGITNISIDHQKQLGNDLGSIAKEKSGVFKKGIPVVTVQQPDEVMKVFKKQAIEIDSPLSITGKDIDFSYRFETSRDFGPHTRICFSTPTSKFDHLRVPLLGKHQAINCGLALAMIDKLKTIGYNVDNEKTMEGLEKVKLPGRMEMVWDDPRIIIDGAHNAASIRALIHALGQNIPYDSMVVIFGCNTDKDVSGMLRQLQYGADKVIFTRSNSQRAMSPDDIGELYNEISGKMYQTAKTLSEALRIAQNSVGREDLVCITGSFYLVGQAKSRFDKIRSEIEVLT